MSSNRFLARVLLIILTIVSFHILGIEVLISFVMAPTLDEFKRMLVYPLPIAVPMVGLYCVVVYFYCKPVRDFLDSINNGRDTSRETVRAAQDRCISLAYFLAALSFPAYILGGSGGAYLVCLGLGWPVWVCYYGLLGGVIAGLMTIPMSIYATGWAAGPTIELTLEHTQAYEAARTGGLRMSLQQKLVLVVFVMVVGITGYAALLGYSQTSAVLDNMEKMEKLLPNKIAGELKDVVFTSTDTSLKSSAYFRSRMGSLGTVFAGLLVVGSLLALVVGIATAREMTRPIRVLKEMADKISAGDYEYTAKMVSNDELAQLGGAFNRMTRELLAQLELSRSMVDSIRETVQVLAPISQDLVVVAEDQASRSVQQASAAEQAAAGSQETAMVAKQIAESAGTVALTSDTALEITSEGKDNVEMVLQRFGHISSQVNHMANTISALAEQAREIEGIIKLIDEISDQTSLLALNASLEAAGAGTNGRRFGVVASEVQRLARDTANATKIVQDKITAIQTTVRQSAELAEQSHQAVGSGRVVIEQMAKLFIDINQASGKAAARLKEIDMMTSQQATASEQMTHVISEVKQTAQQGSASADDIRDSLVKLEDLVANLQKHIEVEA